MIGLGIYHVNLNIFLSPFPPSPRIHRSHTLGIDAGSFSCAASAGMQPFPSSPAVSSLSTNPFSFLGVQISESRGLSGREAAVGCLQGGRKGVWGSQDVGGSPAATGNLLREKENLAILESCWEG